MTKKFTGSISQRLIWIIFLVTSLTTFTGYSTFLSIYMNDQYEKALTLSETIGEVLAQDFAKVILLNEVAVAAEITTKLSSFDSVKSMILYKKNGMPIYQFSHNNKSFKVEKLPKENFRKSEIKKNTLKLYLNSSYLGTDIGYIQLSLKIDSLGDVIRKNLLTALSLYAFMLFMSYVLALFFAKRFTSPILTLVKFLEKVELFSSITTRVKTQENNEYGKLYEEVNIMLDRIEYSYKESQISAVAFETQSGMTITDANHTILKVNKAFSKITGYSPQEAIGRTPAMLKSGVQGEQFYIDMMRILKSHNYWSGEIYNRHKDGTIYPEFLTIQTVLNDENTPIYYVASFVDISLQKETEAKLQYLKQYDTLTGLVNKALLLNRLQSTLKEKTDTNYGALICFDIKEFKLVNDAYGHTNGDALLQQIAQRLKENCNQATLIGRIGADEFILWFKDIGESKESASISSKDIVHRLINALSKSFNIAQYEMHTVIHIGISLYSNTDKNAAALFKEADSALHTAKRQEKEFAFYDKQAQEIALTHIDMYTQLRNAIEKDQFELLYQLQYHDNKVTGAEALIRWNHPQRGVISPLEFIPVAEKTGLILPLGEWIINEACKELAKWNKNPETKHLSISINISAKQFAQESFISQINSAVSKYGVIYSSLKIELTESVIADDLDLVIAKMKELQELGAKTSLDDFGTGYSSLEYLKKLPLNQVKIDQAFVKNMLDDKSDIAIIKSILLISEARGLEVIAEGVETKEHYELLKELGCNHFQGYYFARPKKTSELVF